MRMNAPGALGGFLLLLSSVALAQTGPAPTPESATPGPAPAPQYAPPAPAPAPQYATQAPAPAPQYAPPEEISLVRRYAVGPRIIFAPGVFIPSNGSAGFALGVEGGYGFDLGPVILTPIVSFQGNWSSDWTVYTGLGGLRVTLPLGNFGPFVEGGVGYGHVGGPLGYSSGGLAVRGGAGFIIFFGERVALGISGRYDAIIDTPFKGWTIAPMLLLTF